MSADNAIIPTGYKFKEILTRSKAFMYLCYRCICMYLQMCNANNASSDVCLNTFNLYR